MVFGVALQDLLCTYLSWILTVLCQNPCTASHCSKRLGVTRKKSALCNFGITPSERCFALLKLWLQCFLKEENQSRSPVSPNTAAARLPTCSFSRAARFRETLFEARSVSGKVECSSAWAIHLPAHIQSLSPARQWDVIICWTSFFSRQIIWWNILTMSALEAKRGFQMWFLYWLRLQTLRRCDNQQNSFTYHLPRARGAGGIFGLLSQLSDSSWSPWIHNEFVKMTTTVVYLEIIAWEVEQIGEEEGQRQ